MWDHESSRTSTSDQENQQEQKVTHTHKQKHKHTPLFPVAGLQIEKKMFKEVTILKKKSVNSGNRFL